jgi:hypothetical protein
MFSANSKWMHHTYGQWERASKMSKYFSVIAEKYFK